MQLDEKSLALLYESPDTCPGPYRIVHKLPALPEGSIDAERVNEVVVNALLAQDDFVADIGRLTAAALVRAHGESALFSSQNLRSLSGQIATSLAVALLRSRSLEHAIHQSIGAMACYDQAAIACPE